jgi:hypothetical protein
VSNLVTIEEGAAKGKCRRFNAQEFLEFGLGSLNAAVPRRPSRDLKALVPKLSTAQLRLVHKLTLEVGFGPRYCLGEETQNMDRVSALPIQDFEGMVAEVWHTLNVCLYHAAYVRVYADTGAMRLVGSKRARAATQP